MKKILILLFAVASVFSVSSSYAQIKIGRVNTQELVQLLPETDSAKLQIDNLATDLKTQIEEFQVELRNKYEDYQKKSASYSDAIRQAKEKEIMELNDRGQQLQEAAQQDLSNLQQKLMTPIIAKIEASIEKVSKAQGLTLTIDMSQGVFAFVDNDKTIDILPFLKTDLKITK